jgi:hypothetical protein
MFTRQCVLCALAVALAWGLSSNPAAAQTTCTNTLIVRGINKSGVPDKALVSLKRLNYDYMLPETQRQNKGQVDFMGTKPAKVADSSLSYNCAGYVLNRLRSIGLYNTNVQEVRELFEKFGEPARMRGTARTGFVVTVKVGDIVIYGTDVHVAFVESVNPITIVGKDNEGAVFRYREGDESSSAISRWGERKYWTLDWSRITSWSKNTEFDECGPCELGSFAAPAAVEVSCPHLAPAPSDTAFFNKQAHKTRQGLINEKIHEWKTAANTEVSVAVSDNGSSGRRGSPKVITRTYTVTPMCERKTGPATITMVSGLPATLTQVITVEDKVPPSFPVPVSATVTGCQEDPLPKPPPGYQTAGKDNCGGNVTITYTDSVKGGRGSTTDPLVVERTFTAKDESGNSKNYLQVFKVVDTIPPKLTGATPSSICLKTSDRFPSPDPGSIHAQDNCSTDRPQVAWIEDLLSRPGTGRPGDPRVVVRKYQVSDRAGNSIDVRQTITVEDDAAPMTERFENPSIAGGRLDWCAIFGENCGTPAANAFCRLKGYARSVNHEKAPNLGRTKLVNGQDCDCVSKKCGNYTCDGFKYVTCVK